MYLIVIAWIYVVLMMSVAEATNTTGTVLGALVTFVLYGLAPVGLVIYLMRAPARNKAAKLREAKARAAHLASLEPASVAPDAGGHAASGHEAIAAEPGIPAVGKEA